MEDRRFSDREGVRVPKPIVYDAAPDGLRYGLREILHGLGYRAPTDQRRILCLAMRTSPDPDNWTDYPNVDDEVVRLLTFGPWYRLLDALERIPLYLSPELTALYYSEMNLLLSEEGVGYRFEYGKLTRVGAEEFHAALDQTRSALGNERFAEALRQLERAVEFRNSRPPDWANAIKEAVNSVEATLQIVYARPGVALTTISSDDFPPELPSGIRQLFRSLYSQGSGTVGARHASIGGNEPTAARAELAIHVAAALHTYAVAELDV